MYKGNGQSNKTEKKTILDCKRKEKNEKQPIVSLCDLTDSKQQHCWAN